LSHQTTSQKSLDSISWANLYAQFQGFVAFRLPGQSVSSVYAANQGFCKVSFGGLHDLPEGFLVNPFDPDSPFSWFLHPQIRIDYNEAGQVYQQFLFDHKPLPGQWEPEFARPIAETNLEPQQETTEDNYIRNVEVAKDAIELGNFSKVVIARLKKHKIDQVPSMYELFKKACSAYPHAFIYLMKWVDGSVWLGATPELLVESSRWKFTTQAVAGTRRYDPDTPIDQTSWTQKEIEEQAMVSRYIIECFKKIRVREYFDFGPKTFLAGNLLHLKTEFTVNKREVKYPHIESAMLRLLHPTSAVCGMPKQEALRFIQQMEGFDRELYSGFLGPVNRNAQSNLYVNLRSGKLKDNQLTTFAGAGITASSNAQLEWVETEAKMETLLDLFLTKC
jgi:isochorismate synthase